MSKRLQAKHKIDRRLGENLWGRAKSPVNKRSYGPGQHGQAKSKLSDYGVQLRAKQKLKFYYGPLGEKQFRNIYKRAINMKGDTGENMIGLLESRLDAIVYRAKFAPTIFAARQFVSHGHIKVNGKRVNIASYRVKVGDTIELKKELKENVVVLAALNSSEREVPDYLSVESHKLTATYSRIPQFTDVPYPVQMQPNLVIEFYSR
jgi:small subunit ribosomal protein S4